SLFRKGEVGALIAFRRIFEQSRVVVLHLAQLGKYGRLEGFAAVVAGKVRELIEGCWIGRECMGLLVGHHLQAVLNAAKKAVSLAEFVARGGADPTTHR